MHTTAGRMLVHRLSHSLCLLLVSCQDNVLTDWVSYKRGIIDPHGVAKKNFVFNKKHVAAWPDNKTPPSMLLIMSVADLEPSGRYGCDDLERRSKFKVCHTQQVERS